MSSLLQEFQSIIFFESLFSGCQGQLAVMVMLVLLLWSS